MIRKFFWFIFSLFLLCTAAVFLLGLYDKKAKYTSATGNLEVPEYTSVSLDFSHNYKRSRGLPFAAGAVIDVDNDGNDELFLGGGVRQSDGLFVFLDDHFIDVADQANLVKQGDDMTLGAVVLDYDKNGYQDLIISRENGIWLYRNEQGKFTAVKLDIPIPAEGAPLSLALADLNRDGFIDFFVPMAPRISISEWLSFKKSNAQINSKLFLNKGDDTFYDITESAGMNFVEGAIQAVFADLDEDGLEDLTILHANGLLSTWRNRGNLLFENMRSYHTTLDGSYGGLGTGDYNSDGRIDFFLSNSGSTIPRLLPQLVNPSAEAKHVQWLLLQNTGYFSFRDEAERAWLADYEISRGALFADLNGDNYNDLVVSQNHPYWPPYLIKPLRLNGKILLQNSSGEFTDFTLQAGVSNTGYSISPLTGDFNKDGRQDLVLVNLGGKSQVYISRGGKSNFVQVKLADIPQSLGAVVSVKTLSGFTLKKHYIVGKELCSDSSHTLYFGLNNDKAIDVMVDYLDGKKDQKSGVFFNTTITFD